MAGTNSLNSILESSMRLLADHGFEGWSIERVARSAGCAKALVIHHYGTRAGLLVATGTRVGAIRLEARLTALVEGGTAALDRLWLALADDVRAGLSRATFSLAAQGYASRGPGDVSALHRAVAQALDVPAEALAEAPALAAMLEGLEFQMLQGSDPTQIRAAFDRLWITLIEPA